MNIYKTKSGCYINMDNVDFIEAYIDTSVEVFFARDAQTLVLTNDEAKAFIDYLNRHLNTVFEGYA